MENSETFWMLIVCWLPDQAKEVRIVSSEDVLEKGLLCVPVWQNRDRQVLEEARQRVGDAQIVSRMFGGAVFRDG